MPLYFAYGANMDVEAMRLRAPSAKALGIARLPRHRFVIMAEGYASVVRDARFAVHGLLWEVSLGDMRGLDRFEGLAQGLYVKINQPVVLAPPAKVDAGFAPGEAARMQTGAKRALLYVGQGKAGGKPRAGYLEGVLAAGHALGLPAAYLKEIESWAGKPVTGKPITGKPVGGTGADGKDASGPVAGVQPRAASPMARGAGEKRESWRWED